MWQKLKLRSLLLPHFHHIRFACVAGGCVPFFFLVLDSIGFSLSRHSPKSEQRHRLGCLSSLGPGKFGDTNFRMRARITLCAYKKAKIKESGEARRNKKEKRKRNVNSSSDDLSYPFEIQFVNRLIFLLWRKSLFPFSLYPSVSGAWPCFPIRAKWRIAGRKLFLFLSVYISRIRPKRQPYWANTITLLFSVD